MPPKDPIKWNSVEFRSLDTFGISGQLLPDAEVYCTTLFSTRHIGRVSDLLAAKLESLGANEFQLRCSILVSIFEACRNLGSNRKFSTPLLLECGLDGEKVAIGVNFAMEDGMVINGKPHGPFGAVLSDIQKNSDLTLLKLDPSTRRVEIVALLGLVGVDGQPIQTPRPPIRLLNISPGESGGQKSAPKPAKYLDLGDLDYDSLLKSDSPVKLTKKTKIEIPALDEEAIEEIKVKGNSDEDESEQTVKGSDNEDEGSQKIKGDEDDEDESQTIKGEEDAEEGARVVKGGKRKNLASKKVIGKNESEEDFEVRIAGDEPELQDDLMLSQGSGKKKKQKSDFTQSESFFGKISTKFRNLIGQTSDNREEDSDFQQNVLNYGKAVRAKTDAANEPALDTSAIEKELQSGEFDQLVVSVEKDMNQLKLEGKNSKVSACMDNLMTKLLKEKARLSDLTRKVNLSLRLKEIEFKDKSGALREEIRKRDLMVTQKNAALVRTREQLMKISESYEKLKVVKGPYPKVSGTEELYQRQKLNASQTIITSLKDENTLLVRKIEELKKSTGTGGVKVGASANQYADLHGRYERLFKQSEELKKNNQQLMEKLMDPKRSSSPGGSSDDFRRKLEASMQLLAAEKKEKEALKARVLGTQQDQVKLRDEIRRLTLENKRLAQVGAAPHTPATQKKPDGSGSVPPASGKAA